MKKKKKKSKIKNLPDRECNYIILVGNTRHDGIAECDSSDTSMSKWFWHHGGRRDKSPAHNFKSFCSILVLTHHAIGPK